MLKKSVGDEMLKGPYSRRKISICLPIVIALQAGASAGDTTPPDDQGVTIYERIDFGGDSRVLVADVSDLSDLQGPCGIGDGNWSDCMSSIQLSSRWTAILYELEGFEGDSLSVTSSISNLENFPGCDADWNRCAKSIRVRRPIDHDSSGFSEMHPLDIPDEAGFYVYSDDGNKALRLFGSFRMLTVLDNKQNFHAYDLVPPKIPTGDEDFRNVNSIWTIKMSRVGFDALVRGRPEQRFSRTSWLIRLELDWKGDTENFRIRHFFLRSKNWLIGQSWSTMNNLSFLPLAVDGRLTGAGLGMRTPQIRYYSSYRNWGYQVALEYRKTTMIKPASLSAISQVGFPDLVGRVSHKAGRSELAIAAMLRPNRLQFPDDENRVQQLLGYGGVFGINYRLGDQNRLKFKIGISE